MRGQNFIRIIDNTMTEEQCGKLINTFDTLHELGATYTRQEIEGIAKNYKTDTSLNSYDLIVSNLFSAEQNKEIFNVLKLHINKYITDFETGMFPSEYEYYPVALSGVKIQKTMPSEGYHIWHCENNVLVNNSRFIAFTLYLNNIDEGGETEFIHLSERVQPKTGRLVIFPAGWTHAHRGNPPLVDNKYIITGWMEYTV